MTLHPLNCRTCDYLKNKNWAGSGDCRHPKLDESIYIHISASGYDNGIYSIISELGCASHSNASNRDLPHPNHPPTHKIRRQP